MSPEAGRQNPGSRQALPLDDWCNRRLGLTAEQGPTPRQALLRHQCAALANTLGRASNNSLHYSKALGRARAEVFIKRLIKLSSSGYLNETDFLNLLSELPFTTPPELADSPESFLAVPHDDIDGLISIPSSGSSGKMKRVFCSGADLDSTVDFFRNGMRVLLNPEQGERTAMLMSGARPGGTGDLFARAMTALGVTSVITGLPDDEDELFRILEDFNPSCLVGHPAHLFALTRHPRLAKLRPGLRSVLITGDAVPDALAKVVGEALGATAFRHYGLTEIGLGGAVECAYGAGCHLREMDFIAEIVTPEGARLMPDPTKGMTGWGEVVVTTLTRQAMPLIRYRTGDIGRVLTAPCRCGSSLRRLEVMGRASEFLPEPCGADWANGAERAFNAVHSSELDALLCGLDWIKSWRIITAKTQQSSNCRPEHEILICLETLPKAPPAPAAVGKVMELIAPVMSRLDQNAVRVYAVAKAPAFFRCRQTAGSGKRGILRTNSETLRHIAGITVTK